MHGSAGATVQAGTDGRPTEPLSLRELFDLNAYWLAINILWGAIGISLLPILMVDLVCSGQEACSALTPILPGLSVGKGTAEAIIVNLGVIIAILVQPTVAAISDHTSSRIGRRKPYIIVGTILDMVFLVGLYLAGAWIGVLVFYCLLQFSSNFAQGPFQGYMPDLVPAEQVGLASGLMGLMILLGVGGGAILVAVAISLGDARYVIFPIMAVELVTMLLTVTRVRDGRQGIPRQGRSWPRVAREAWGTDILRERSYLWLLGSRLFFLMTGTTLVATAFFFMQDTFGLERGPAANLAGLAAILIVVFGALATVPSGRMSGRIGKKRMIYGSAVIGLIGMVLLALAPSTESRPRVRRPDRRRIRHLPGGRLGVDDRHHPEGGIGSLHGHQQCRDRLRRRDRDGRRARPDGCRQPRLRPRDGAASGVRRACSYYVIGSLLLTRVDERRREDVPTPVDIPVEPSAAPAG